MPKNLPVADQWNQEPNIFMQLLPKITVSLYDEHSNKKDSSKALPIGDGLGEASKTIQSRYNYAEIWQWLEQKGKEVFGEKFQLYEKDKSSIYLLFCWFLQDDIAAP